MKKVLVIGGGGREHALCVALARSPQVGQVFCAPGNGGIASVAECLPELLVGDFDRLAAFAAENEIDLTVVGPENPLVDGIVDYFRERGLAIFGPDAKGAQLEGSKAFAKDLMARHNVPTAAYHVFDDFDEAHAHLQNLEYFPIVLKADGLAAGKGVVVCEDRETALQTITEMMAERRFGEASARVVIEEFLRGEEASVHAVTDGKTLMIFPTSQDHKAIHEGDKGPNTGGMGAYSPAPIAEGAMLDKVVRDVLVPVLNGLHTDGIEYRGVLYAGLMITKGGPRVVEFNARFGDPETEVMLPRLKSDLYEILFTAATGRLADLDPPEFDERPCMGVVMASQGYPGEYQSGKPMFGTEDADALADVTVYHAGTRLRDDGGLSTAGGRVLCVTALGDDLQGARDRAYEGVSRIRWEGAYYRTDIGHRVL
ncbi:MAG: phosphoribosylamine--glycine ligase [Planctomycetota bacterium]|nr:phosphoribosylamine--glycine ligase [Planctomycetota bacterium]